MVQALVCTQNWLRYSSISYTNVVDDSISNGELCNQVMAGIIKPIYLYFIALNSVMLIRDHKFLYCCRLAWLR